MVQEKWSDAELEPGAIDRETVKTCAVVCTVRDGSRWMEDFLRSVRCQQPLEGWRYELRVGIDDCSESVEEARRLGLTFAVAGRHVGPFVMRNSLIDAWGADAYAIFDVDDLMMPRYLQKVVPLAMPDGMAGSGRRNVDEGGRVASQVLPFGGGLSVISHEAWRVVGGFLSWPIAADIEFLARAKKLGVRVATTNRALYLRRIHPQSLTQRMDTGTQSKLRRSLKERIPKELVACRRIPRKPEVVSLKWEHGDGVVKWKREKLEAGPARGVFRNSRMTWPHDVIP